MESVRKHIGSPSAIIAFEAAGRHMNFTKAARELNVSQPAISRQIRNLEQHIGTKLFLRRGNNIRFTDQGLILFEATNASFNKIVDAVNLIRHGSREKDFVLRSQPIFLSTFVLPLMRDFQLTFPDCAINIQALENTAAVDSSGNTISILYGDGNWPGMKSDLLFNDIYFPVCKPQVLADLKALDLEQGFSSLNLLQMSEFIDPWMKWENWGKHFEIDALIAKRPQKLNDYEMLLRSCRSGLGVAIGALHQIEESLNAGSLVRYSDMIITSKFGFYMVYQPERIENAYFEKILSWLHSRAEKTHTRCLALL